MHGYSGTSGMCASVRGNAQYLRDKGFFAISVALRGRDGCDGTRDSGGLEIYDIYDAVEAVKRDYPGFVDPATVYITGYSGGGGNTMAALTKFPDYFNAGAAYFGMSDYGYHLTNAWYFAGASSSHQSIMRTDVGNPTGGVAGVRDRYHARASNLASANNPYSEIHLFVNADETTCPPVNMTTFLSNAVSREAYAGEFSNITVHIGQSGLYEDFNANGLNDEDELQVWPHGAPTASQQAAAEAWFMERLLAGQIPRRPLNAADTLYVAGFVKTSRFECRVGDGQQGMVQLDYALTATNLVFHAAVLSLDKQRLSRLTVDTAAFSNQTVDVLLNGTRSTSFMGGGSWTTDALRDGDTLELQAAGPTTVWWEDAGVTKIERTSAWASATLAGSRAEVWCFSGTNSPGQQREGWSQSAYLGSAVMTGQVTAALDGLRPATAYSVVFYATNAFTGDVMWSEVMAFTTLPAFPKLLAYYAFEAGLTDQTTNAFDGTSVTSGGAGATFTNQVPAALAGASRAALCLDGASWVKLPFLNLYNRARSGGVSVSFWVKGGSSASVWMLAEGCTTSTAPAYCFGPKAGVTTLRAFVRTDANSGRLDRQSAGAVFDDAWHHVVWTDSAGTTSLFIDGAAADSASLDYTPGTLTMNTTVIGALERKPSDPKYPFAGWLDDLSVWGEALNTNSVAALSAGLSPQEVAGLRSEEPLQITGLFAPGTSSLSLAFRGPELAVQPRAWYTSNMASAAWEPVATLMETTRSNGVYYQSYEGAPTGPSAFFKVVY
jgi:hypothetical protein